MSPKERVIQQIKHKQTDFSPYTIEYEEEVREKLNDYYGGDFWESYINNHILAIPNPLTELKPRKIGENIEVDIYGTKWRTDLKPMHIVEVPLKETGRRNILERLKKRRIISLLQDLVWGYLKEAGV